MSDLSALNYAITSIYKPLQFLPLVEKQYVIKDDTSSAYTWKDLIISSPFSRLVFFYCFLSLVLG